MAALFGGLRAGLTATILTLPVCDYLFIEPRYTFFLSDAPGDSISLAVFLLLGFAVSIIIERFHQTRNRLRAAHQELQQSEIRLRTLMATAPEMLFAADRFTGDSKRAGGFAGYRKFGDR
jgi:K+-sensing histidine kinase KdpD